jgi:hypothetical protein
VCKIRITIDRIEEDFVVAELPDGQTINIPYALFPDAAEGDVYFIEKDESETDARQERITEKMNRLFSD